MLYCPRITFETVLRPEDPEINRMNYEASSFNGQHFDNEDMMPALFDKLEVWRFIYAALYTWILPDVGALPEENF